MGKLPEKKPGFNPKDLFDEVLKWLEKTLGSFKEKFMDCLINFFKTVIKSFAKTGGAFLAAVLIFSITTPKFRATLGAFFSKYETIFEKDQELYRTESDKKINEIKYQSAIDTTKKRYEKALLEFKIDSLAKIK